MGSGEGFTMRNFIVCNIQQYGIVRVRLAGYVARMEEGRRAF